MIYCLVPARIGSRRLKKKNIFPVLGKPMILWTLEEALKSKFLTKENIFISTESVEIKQICSSFKIIDRPENLSKDDVWTQEVVNHFIEEKNILDDDIIVILQSNSPEIKSETIDECIEKLISNNLWQVHTVDEELINNGAIQVYYAKVKNHKGKVNYNGFVITDWIDIHYEEDVKIVETKILKRIKQNEHNKDRT